MAGVSRSEYMGLDSLWRSFPEGLLCAFGGDAAVLTGKAEFLIKPDLMICGIFGNNAIGK